MIASEKNIINYMYLSTPLGQMLACATDEGICLLEYSDENEPNKSFREIEKTYDTEFIKKDHPHLTQLRQELDEYFSGSRKQFNVPLDLIGTDFQKEVWNVLLDIPYGETRSYTRQSQILKNPKGIRAIASANGKNKIAIVVPCHRVIGRDGSLTGYAGGLHRKKQLLELEAKYAGKPIQSRLVF